MKLNLVFSLCLIALLTSCGGPKECDDSDVLNQIKENTLQILQSQESSEWSAMMRASAEAAEAGLARAKGEVTDVKVADVFNFRKHEDGTRTCKAKITMQSLNGERSAVLKYNVINYEDGYQVEADDSHKYLVGSVVGDYVTQAQAEVDAVRQAKVEAGVAALKDFLAGAPKGNVCADRFDQAAFIRDHVDTDLGDWIYEFDEAFSETVKGIVVKSKIGVAGVQTSGEAAPSDAENLGSSKYLYRCTGLLALTLPDGTVDANEEFSKIYFYAFVERQGSQLVSYGPEIEGKKFDLRGAARSIARKMKYGR
ncbi:hypothetical protein H4W19_12700 [Pseudoxanthomonas mexicana]|uniref:Lipoprotein n=1 Tax=Pseudoxanthomonas mexicana TaxID=128785 RepID=A0ABX6R9L6_PSEMX|nr:hypothetical protein [Pseudoxanthomonas mexicana]QND79216.1 hypothetical protein H4W19_12700 [Pseudoxanthomonas mexicana]